MAAGTGLAPSVYSDLKAGNTASLAGYAKKHFNLDFLDGTSGQEMVDAMKGCVATKRAANKAEVAQKQLVEAQQAAAAQQQPGVDASGMPTIQAAPTAPPAAPTPPQAPATPPIPFGAPPPGGLIGGEPVMGAAGNDLVDATTAQTPPALSPTAAPPSLSPGVVAETAAIDASQAPLAPGLPQGQPGKPLHPYEARGFVPGGAADSAQFYDQNGNPLKPDTHPVLPEREALYGDMPFDYNADQQDPFLQGKFGPAGTRSQKTPHGPQRGPKQFRHPQHVIFLINPVTQTAFIPTELLMRNAKLQPCFTEQLPEGIHFGG